jgi:hypothetical protein
VALRPLPFRAAPGRARGSWPLTRWGRWATLAYVDQEERIALFLDYENLALVLVTTSAV